MEKSSLFAFAVCVVGIIAAVPILVYSYKSVVYKNRLFGLLIGLGGVVMGFAGILGIFDFFGLI